MTMNRFFKSIIPVCICLFWLCSHNLNAQIRWDGGAASSNWSDAANWENDIAPQAGDSVILDHSLITGTYEVILPNSSVSIHSLSIIPGPGNDSIYLMIPSSNSVAQNLMLTGLGFHALQIGNRGALINRHGGNAVLSSIQLSDINNFGILLGNGAYYYHGTDTKDIDVILNIKSLVNSTFEYDTPSNNSIMVFPLVTDVDSISFHHLKFSGNNAISASSAIYAVTLANNWDLIIHGDLTVDNAAFAIVRGDVNQENRNIFIQGNITSQNTNKSSWIDNMSGTTGPITLGWNVILNGSLPQLITGNINFLDSLAIQNPSGISVEDTMVISEIPGFLFPNNPSLNFIEGILNTSTTGLIDFRHNDPSKLTGYAPGGNASSDRYVYGQLRLNITGSGPYFFPMGNNNHYELIKIMPIALTGTSKVTASFHTTSIGQIPVPLVESSHHYKTILDGGYWSLVPDASPVSGQLNIEAFLSGSSFNQGDLTLVSRTNTGSPWTLQGTPAANGVTGNIAFASRDAMTDFFQIGLASSSYAPTDLSISYDNYVNGSSNLNDTLFLNFTVENNGPSDIYAGDTLYFSARINGNYFGLNLLSNKTAIVLTSDLLVGQTFNYNPGYLVPAQLYSFFPGATSIEICSVVWGRGIEAVDIPTPSFPSDTDPTNNTTCVTNDPSLTVNEQEEEFNWTIFPVPVETQLNHTFPVDNGYHFCIINAMGQVVFSSQNLESSIDVTMLSSGFYTLQVMHSGTGKSFHKSFVKKQ
jgi:hypothetical protein